MPPSHITPLIALSTIIILFTAGQSSAQFFAPNECSDTESWVPVEGELPGPARAAAVVDDSLLYVLCDNPTTVNPQHLMRWNGAAWSEVAPYDGTYGARTILKFKGEIHVSTAAAIRRWNGAKWLKVSDTTIGTTSFEVNSGIIAEYNGEIYASGIMREQGKKSQQGIAAWDGNRWRVAGLYGDSSGYVELYSMKVWNGELYVTGSFRKIGGVDVSFIASWNGARWRAAGVLPYPSVSLLTYKGELYGLVNYTWPSGDRDSAVERLFRWDGVAWNPMGVFTADVPSRPVEGASGLAITFDRSVLAEHDGELRGIFHIGSYRTRMTLAGYRWDGGGEHLMARPDRLPDFLIEYRGELYAGGDFTSSCRMPIRYFARLCRADRCTTGIQGVVYHDLNGNCRRDPGEPGLLGRIVELRPGPRYAATDSNGDYRFGEAVEKGSYSVTLAPRLHWRTTCPGPDAIRTFTAGRGQGITGIDFGNQPEPDAIDLRVGIVESTLDPKKPLIHTITYSNVGTTVARGRIDVSYNSRVRFDSSSTPIDSGGALWGAWSFADLKPGESRSITVWTTLEKELASGSNICTAVSIAPVEGTDVNPGDNHDQICGRFPGSPTYQKFVTPRRTATGEILETDSVLAYTIHIAEPSYRYAGRVVIVDTLDEDLDPATVTPIAASHPFTFHIGSSGVITFVIDGLDGPGALHDSLHNHVMVKFLVRLRHQTPGTVITNRASYYIDFGSFLTNGVTSTIMNRGAGVEEMELIRRSVGIYPNPARGVIHLDGPLSAGGRVRLMTVTGEIARSYLCNGSGRMELDITDLPAGAYWVSIPTAKGIVVERVTVVR